MKLIIANFKSNKTRTEHEDWISKFESQISTLDSQTEVVLCPPFVDISLTSNRLQDRKKFKSVQLGIQDISPFPAGSYTGAISTRNLEGFDVKYAIVGHSERRRYFRETNNDIANKVREAILGGITPVVCVTKDTLSEQAHTIEAQFRPKVIVAFEPVENIGTGTADTLEDILKTRELVHEAFGEVKYIYGGSVDKHTDPKILTHKQIDGFLVGGASLDPQNFIGLVQLIS